MKSHGSNPVIQQSVSIQAIAQVPKTPLIQALETVSDGLSVALPDRDLLPGISEPDIRFSARSQIVFIDAAVSDPARLCAGLAPDMEVVMLQSTTDGLRQIAAALADRAGLTSLHLISHGTPGALLLAGARIDLASLPGYAQELRTITDAMVEDAQWLIYGCEVAQGEVGRRFINALGQQTGLRVAVASHRAGAAELGGEWA